MYVKPEELKSLVIDAQTTGRLSDRLALVVVRIAKGLHRRCGWTLIDADDFGQDCVILLMKRIEKADPDGSLFNWLTAVCHMLYCQRAREMLTYERRLKRYKKIQDR